MHTIELTPVFSLSIKALLRRNGCAVAASNGTFGICIESSHHVRWIGYTLGGLPEFPFCGEIYGCIAAARLDHAASTPQIQTHCQWLTDRTRNAHRQHTTGSPMERAINSLMDTLAESKATLRWVDRRSTPALDGAAYAARAARATLPGSAGRLTGYLADFYELALVFDGSPGWRKRQRIGLRNGASIPRRIFLGASVTAEIAGRRNVDLREFAALIDRWHIQDPAARLAPRKVAARAAGLLRLGWPDTLFLRWIFASGQLPARHEVARGGRHVYSALERVLARLNAAESAA